jgi:hypothetical protein
LFSSFPSLRRGAALSLFAALAAGCSANGVAPTSSGSGIGSAQGASLSAIRALANGQGIRMQTARTGSGWISPDAKKKKSLIYWGNYDSSTITIYSGKGVNGKEVGQITSDLSNPERLFVDAKGSVYATNIGTGTITAYKAGQTSPFITISNGVNRPTGITVDAAGTVYCANVGNDTITEYPAGSTTASVTISVPSSPEYLATDAQDNLYAEIGSAVYEFPKGSTSGTNLGLSISAGALEVDRNGNLIVIDESTDDVDYFAAGQTTPSTEIPVTAGDPFALSLSKNEKELYVSVLISGGFEIQSIAYPKGTSFANKLTTDAGDWPIAVSPDNALGS